MKKIPPPRLLIRADGSSSIGFGHLMRCIALAEEWMDRGGECLWTTTGVEALQKVLSTRTRLTITELKSPSGSQADARETSALAESWQADWILADLYQIQPDYFQGAGAEKSRWALISDGPVEVSHRIDAILSPGPQATPEFFPGRSEKCTLLTGFDYTLLRNEIRAGNRKTSPSGARQNLLITFGGSDPEDLTWLTLMEMQRNAPAYFRFKWQVILGGGYQGKCRRNSGLFPDLSIEYITAPPDMSVHYAWADLIICSASTTLWEALYIGIPALVMPAADNQQIILEKITEAPMIKCFPEPGPALNGWVSEIAAETPAARNWIKESTGAGRAVIDGRGIQRSVDYLYS